MAISGSLREVSRSRTALLVACESVRATGAAVDLVDLRQVALPFFDHRSDSDYPPVVHDFRARLSAADGYLLATAQLHSGPSGALKNAIDFVHYPDCETTGKPFGLIAIAGGRHAAWPTLGILRLIGRALCGWVLPQQVTASASEFDSAGHLVDQEVTNRLRHLGHSLAYHAQLFAYARATMPPAARVGHHNQREPLAL